MTTEPEASATFQTPRQFPPATVPAVMLNGICLLFLGIVLTAMVRGVSVTVVLPFMLLTAIIFTVRVIKLRTLTVTADRLKDSTLLNTRTVLFRDITAAHADSFHRQGVLLMLYSRQGLSTIRVNATVQELRQVADFINASNGYREPSAKHPLVSDWYQERHRRQGNAAKFLFFSLILVAPLGWMLNLWPHHYWLNTAEPCLRVIALWQIIRLLMTIRKK
jgi:hypothetical protein